MVDKKQRILRVVLSAGLHRLIAFALLLTVSRLTAAQDSTTQAPISQPPDSQPGQTSFPGRLVHFYWQDWHPQPPSSSSSPVQALAAPTRRGLPSPLDSPPFPSADWSYGASPTIGEPDGNSYPLMTAINGARSRVKVYGWLEPTVNLSTSAHSNAPVANDPYSNRAELNQAVVYVERLPNTVQRDHFDWGFHATALFGTDYRYTVDKGYLSSQLIDHNRQYGFDPTMEYFDLYYPRVGQGMNVRVGRFISPPGIEAQLSPNNYVFSHSLLYSIDPFTDTGVIATVQLNPQWIVQAGITSSHDVAPWTSDAKPSAVACLSYSTTSVNDNFYGCANGINDGKYAYNNLQQLDLTWYHRFSKTLHMAAETYSMYQRDVPAVGGPITPEKGTNGAFCAPGLSLCLAPEYAVSTYVNKELSQHTFVTFRGDLLNDKKGQRTGVNTRLTEFTFALSHWVGSTIQVRPELRLDHSWDRKVYDRSTRFTQFTAASDLIFHF